MTELIILAATPRGLDLARRLRQALGHGAVVDASDTPLRAVQKALRQGRPLACVLPTETVIRAIAPFLAGGDEAVPILVIDEAGQYVIHLLGPAAPLTRQIAGALNATPIVTAGSATLAVPDVRLIGRKWGWKIEEQDNLERVALAVRQGQPVGVYQDAGQRDWWQPFGPWPHHFERLSTWPTEARWAALLVISDRVLPASPAELRGPTVVYRPPTLTLGVACRRGVAATALSEYWEELCSHHRLSPRCLSAIGTTARRRHERGLGDFAEELELPLLAYAPDKLALVAPPGRLGSAAACEPAAMLAAGVREVIVPKTLFRSAALAVARRPVG